VISNETPRKDHGPQRWFGKKNDGPPETEKQPTIYPRCLPANYLEYMAQGRNWWRKADQECDQGRGNGVEEVDESGCAS